MCCGVHVLQPLWKRNGVFAAGPVLWEPLSPFTHQAPGDRRPWVRWSLFLVPTVQAHEIPALYDELLSTKRCRPCASANPRAIVPPFVQVCGWVSHQRSSTLGRKALDGLAFATDSGPCSVQLHLMRKSSRPEMDYQRHIHLQGLILLRTTTNTTIKALLIDAEFANPSVPIHYSRYNFSLSGWQLIPRTLVYSGNYQEQKEPLN